MSRSTPNPEGPHPFQTPHPRPPSPVHNQGSGAIVQVTSRAARSVFDMGLGLITVQTFCTELAKRASGATR